jgi:hypothetical protein
MTALIIILVSILIVALAVYFFKQLAGLTLIFLGGFILGFVVLFFDLNLGAQIIGWCLGLFLFLWLLIGIAGIISTIVVGPIAMIVGGIRLFFDRLFK